MNAIKFCIKDLWTVLTQNRPIQTMFYTNKKRNKIMEKYVSFLTLIFLATPVMADSNIFFGDKINSITIYGAQSTGSGTLLKMIQPGIWKISPQTFIMAQYSQPMKFFRLDSRLNFNVGQNISYKSSRGLNFFGKRKIISAVSGFPSIS